ncbi:transmembrane protein 229A-like [Amphiura filiformis]|uniref:transmembrane protein 229A-like n=1 Tax=Amphiura filiformis TaxID=82378 RepID=UPI003B223943
MARNGSNTKVNSYRQNGASAPSSSGSPSPTYKPLPTFIRLFFYGLHGFFDEIVFTAIYEIIYGIPDARLLGYTSLYSFFIYSTGSYIIEQLYLFLWVKHGISTVPRIMLYVCVAFIWEFSFGLILRQFDACPWDYSDRALNFMGLITLTYAPGWAFLGFWQDRLSVYLLNLRIVPDHQKVM